MILPPAATAASGADPSNPSLDQYVESVPTSHGGPPPSHGSIRDGGSGSQDGHLPASIRHRLAASGGSDAKQLEAIATSPAFGAPTTKPTPPAGTADGGASGGAAARSAAGNAGGSTPSGLDAFTTAATHGESGSVGVLAIGLVLITLLAGGTALARRRANIA